MPPRPEAIQSVAGSPSAWIRLMVFGDPGTGKTPLAGTSPKCLILDADDGTQSAAVLESKADRWPIREHQDLTDAAEYLRHGGFNDYDWCWMDSFTLFQEKGLDDIMRTLVANKSHRKIYAPDKGEFGQNMNRIKIFVREVVDLPINLGFTAHRLYTEDDDGKVLYMPAIQGKGMPSTICGYMNMVGYLEKRVVKGQQGLQRVLDFSGGSKFYGKDRFMAIKGGKMLNPTIPKLEALVAAKVPRPKRPAVQGRRLAAKAVPVKKATKAPAKKVAGAKKTTASRRTA